MRKSPKSIQAKETLVQLPWPLTYRIAFTMVTYFSLACASDGTVEPLFFGYIPFPKYSVFYFDDTEDAKKKKTFLTYF